MGGVSDVQTIIGGTFLLLGAGFLVANTRLALEYLRYMKRRSGALLTWRGPKPPYYVMQLAIGVFLGVILIYNVGRMYRLYEGFRVDARGPERFATFLGDEVARWAKVIKAADIRAD